MKVECNHEHTQTGEDYPFITSVAVHPYTEENRAAHGGVSYTETCMECGAERSCNANGSHIEVSPWGESAHERPAYWIERDQARVGNGIVTETLTRAEIESRARAEMRPTDGRYARILAIMESIQ